MFQKIMERENQRDQRAAVCVLGPKEGGSRHQTHGRGQDLMEPPAPQDPPRSWAKTVANCGDFNMFQYLIDIGVRFCCNSLTIWAFSALKNASQIGLFS